VRWAIDLVDLSTGRQVAFATRDDASSWPQVGSFRVDPEAVAAGERALDPETVREADLVVIDEVGPWELSGNGWAQVLERLRCSEAPPLLLVVRRSLVDEVLARFAPSGAPVWSVSVSTVDEVVAALARAGGGPVQH
jgi:nucleoside-triphosphatase THEP1